jgi:hypothetical protein
MLSPAFRTVWNMGLARPMAGNNNSAVRYASSRCGYPERMNVSTPTLRYSDNARAIFSGLPTKAVPAPPRTSPTPAHKILADPQAVSVAVMQPRHAPLADGLGRGKSRLSFCDLLVAEMLDQAVRLAPGLLLGFTHDDVGAQAKPHAATTRLRLPTDVHANFCATSSGRSPQDK